jgi:hypothetical protein
MPFELTMNDPAVFREHIDTVFRVASGAGDVDLRLVDVSEELAAHGIKQFALFLHGPPEALLPQGTYVLEHDHLGSFAWFMVPVAGSTRERIVYQVCFSLVAD